MESVEIDRLKDYFELTYFDDAKHLSQQEPPPPQKPARRSTRLAKADPPTNPSPPVSIASDGATPRSEGSDLPGFDEAITHIDNMLSKLDDGDQGNDSRVSIESATKSFVFHCRCGEKGTDVEGGDLEKEMGSEDRGALICCDRCNLWMHMACQRWGRAGGLLETESFKCDVCSYVTEEFFRQKQWLKKNVNILGLLESEQQTGDGVGVLVHIGDFHYPGRIIRAPRKKEKVKTSIGKLWPWCFIADTSDLHKNPSGIQRGNGDHYVVSPARLVDALVCDGKARRQIRKKEPDYVTKPLDKGLNLQDELDKYSSAEPEYNSRPARFDVDE
ncbi:hypothetical protein BDV98DRAFT_607681, partial [Pterulicium gracile]